jgi:uncharacterized protein (DUF1800 family)
MGAFACALHRPKVRTDLSTLPSAQYRPAGALHVEEALQPYRGDWDARKAAHLARRAGFSANPQEIARLADMSMDQAVNEYLHFPNTDELPQSPSDLVDPRSLMLGPDGQMLKEKELSETSKKAVNTAYHDDLIALQKWWLNRMIQSPAPLQEKMTLFWHGHFTSAYREKGISPQMMLNQNSLFRSNALGNIRDLTLAVSRDPAMLLYLDNAHSNKLHPNENYARELMELFTLGIGNYSEQDIRESARALTGWSVDKDGVFRERPHQHDDGMKTFLGKQGAFDGNDVVDIIFDQPACSKFFAERLLSFFVYSDPEPELIDAVAKRLRDNNYQLAPVMATLLHSNVFYSTRAYRALVKSPVEYVIGLHRLLGVDELDKDSLGMLSRSGQTLFRPPNVKGWDGGLYWINSEALLTRNNFATQLMRSRKLRTGHTLFTDVPGEALPAAQYIARAVLQYDLSQDDLEYLVEYLDGRIAASQQTFSMENYDERVRGAFYLSMAMPAYQLN